MIGRSIEALKNQPVDELVTAVLAGDLARAKELAAKIGGGR